jgi:hypothetical protein
LAASSATASSERGEHHVTIPRHDPLKVGTLAGILGDVAAWLEISGIAKLLLEGRGGRPR